MIQNQKIYDLEDRTFKFAERCRDFVNQLQKTTINIEYGKQLIRSSGSQAANYIEANEALSKKDFAHRMRISRKEVKESRLWLRLCDIKTTDILYKECQSLIQEALELVKIFTTIINKSL